MLANTEPLFLYHLLPKLIIEIDKSASSTCSYQQVNYSKNYAPKMAENGLEQVFLNNIFNKSHSINSSTKVQKIVLERIRVMSFLTAFITNNVTSLFV